MKPLRTFCWALVLAALAFASCRDEAATSVTGAYTFKTGGQVKVLPTVLAADSVDAVAACSALSGYDLTDLWAPLMPESGQMNLVYTNEAKDSVILAFTALLGDLCTLTGKLSGDTLTLSGGDMKSMQVTDGTASLGGGFVNVSGGGILYNGALILDLYYDGSITSTTTGRSTEMTITDSRIQCVAQTFPYLGLDVYAYKTGGQVKLMPTVLTDSLVNAVDASSALIGYDLHDLWLPLKPEAGALNIAGTDAEGNLLTLSFNALLGDVCTLKATTIGDEVVLTNDNTKTMQLTDGEQSLGGGIVAVTGSGKRTDDMLLLDFDYQGTFTTTVTGHAVQMTIVDSKVQCNAKKNKD